MAKALDSSQLVELDWGVVFVSARMYHQVQLFSTPAQHTLSRHAVQLEMDGHARPQALS